MKWLKSLAVVLTVIAAVLFGMLWVNQEQVHLTFAIWRTPFALSIFWWMLMAFVGGVVFGVLSGLWAGVKRRMEVRRLKADLAKANAEVERLRDLNLQG